MNDFLDSPAFCLSPQHRAIRENANPSKIKFVKLLATYCRPDTYAAASKIVGLSRTQVFEIIHGKRQTKPATRKALLAWARQQAAKGRAEAPAVATALQTLAA